MVSPMAGAARGLQRALGGGAVALNQARGGGAFGLPGGCAAREQARRCSSPTPSEESAGGGAPGAASGGHDLYVRMACIEIKMTHLEDGQKALKDDMKHVMAGETPFFQALAADVRAAMRWQHRAAGFAACASLFAAYALRHMLMGM